VLERTFDRSGREWLEIRIPRRPNGSTGWVRASELEALHRNDEHLVIDEGALTATLYRSGRKIFSAPVGVGKPSTPTPTGEFWIREKIVALGGGDPIYGPFALGTSDYSTLSEWPGGGVVGIHGTNQPWLVPGRPSHGCIRMHNADITRLYPLIQLGTPITVQ
jgi:lipoprotein-anchoring transpeptidase ErfK/SrfK